MKPLGKLKIEGSEPLQKIAAIAQGKERTSELLASMKLLAEEVPEEEREAASGLIESFIVSWIE